MPTTSSHFSDLEYPTVNQDGDTWGALTNTYIEGLLTKLKDLSDRIDSAGVGSSSDLSQILRDISQYDNINSGIPSAVTSGHSITNLKPPDSYSYETAWNTNYASALASAGLSVPQSQSAVENFNYTLFAETLQPYVDNINSTVETANADISHVNSILARLAAGKSNKLAYIPATSDAGISGTLRIWKAQVSTNIFKQYFNFVPNGTWISSGSTSSSWDTATSKIYNDIDGSSRTSDTDVNNMTMNFGQAQFLEDYVINNYDSAAPGAIIGNTGSYTIKLLSGSVTLSNDLSGQNWSNTSAGYQAYQFFNQSNYPNYTDNIPSVAALSSDISNPLSTGGDHQDFAVTFRFRKYETRALY